MKGLSIGYNRRRDRKELKLGFKSRSYVVSGNRKNPSYILFDDLSDITSLVILYGD